MGFILLLFLIAAIIVALTIWAEDKAEKKASEGIFAAIICGIVGTIFMSIIWGASYSNHLRLLKDLATVEQYEQTVKLYAEKGVEKFRTNSTYSSEITDLKYQSYQVQVGRMIISLRDKIIEYNRNLVSKAVMKTSWFWSWCIIMPKGVKLLKMADYLK